MLNRKSMAAATFCAFAIVGLGATSASAGEVTGTGERVPAIDRANSICVFSGLNDNPLNPLDGFDPGGKSQSYGQENRLGLADPHEFNPGDACRGGSNFERGPGTAG